MKMRVVNHIVAAACVVANILAMIAVLTGMHTLFGTIAVSLSLAVSLGLYLRVFVGTVALKVAEEQEELTLIAVAQKDEPDVVYGVGNWIRNQDTNFMGAKICNLVRATDRDGNKLGYFLLLVGTKSTYRKIEREIGKTCTVLDYWPIDWEEWAESTIEAYIDDPDDDAIPELRG